MSSDVPVNIDDSVLQSLSAEDSTSDRTIRVTRAIMDAMPIMVCVFDQDLRYIYCNKKYISLANPNNPNWRGKRVRDYIPQAAFEFIEDKLTRALNGERVSYHLDLPLSGRSTRSILVNYVPIIRDGGEVVCVMTGQDVTDIKAAEQRLCRAQNLSTLGQLAGGIAHDINNNVGVVVGNISVLKMTSADINTAKHLDACQEAAGRCAALTSQLLSFASRQPLKPRSLLVGEHLKPVAHLLDSSDFDSVEIALVNRAAEAAISVDTVQFCSAVMNLVDNAREAMSAGGMSTGGTITIEASTTRCGDVLGSISERIDSPPHDDTELVCIEVRDTGQGISPDLAKRAFEPFVTTKQGSSGMGLATVYGFVRQSGGFLDLESKVGVGTRVRLYLPRVAPAEHTAESESSGKALPPRRNKHDILVVEDDIYLADITCEMLQLMGHATRLCDNAADAMDLLARTPEIDVVLSDIRLRGSATGLALRQQIRQLFPHVRVICMSGYQDDATRQSYAEEADFEFVTKPFDFHDLAARLGSDRPQPKRRD